MAASCFDVPGVSNSSPESEIKAKKKSQIDLSDLKEDDPPPLSDECHRSQFHSSKRKHWVAPGNGPYWFSSGSVCQKMGQRPQTKYK